MNKIIKRKMMMFVMFFAFTGALFVPVKKTYAMEANNGISVAAVTDKVHYNDSTGVTEVDATLDRGNNFLKGFIKFVGVAAAVVSAAFFFISFPTHQSDMRMQALAGFFISLAIYFTPNIVDYVLGR
ncbi:MAG: hypothetical protein IJ054_06475 [Lachnospiraceae bacterium]|nr:hypothetical protein [Lachnospiraceae bacterium]